MTPRSTTDDFLGQASTAEEVARPRLLSAAEAAARSGGEYVSVAEAWLGLARPADATRCLAAASPRLDVGWDLRRAARVWLQLGDRGRAIEILTTVEARLSALARTQTQRLELTETSGTSWRVLAEAFDELRDTDAVRRCLAAGRSFATEADDLCAVAEGYVQLLDDAATGRSLVEQADVAARSAIDCLGQPDVCAISSVAHCWTSLFDDEERARALLTAGLARAVDVRGCLTMAGAMSDFADEKRVRTAGTDACLAKARQLATSFHDWFTIAEEAHDLAGPAADVRSALARAQALATSDELRSVARATRDWLGDHTAAAALGPMGMLPHELVAPGPSHLGWQRDVGALLDWLRARVDEPMLEAIADADGGYDRDKHLVALLDIHRTGRLPIPLPWEPREVLSLSQWDEGDAVDHVARAFCCTVLCLGELAPRPPGGGIDDTIPVLLESCCVLGRDALEHMAALLVPFADVPPSGEPLGTLATLALLIVTARLDAGDSRLDPLAAHLLAMEAPQAQHGYPRPEHGFVLGATFFDQRVDVWKRLVRESLASLSVPADMLSLAEVVRRLLTDPPDPLGERHPRRPA